MESWKAKTGTEKSWRRVRDGQLSLTSHCTAQDEFVSFSAFIPETCKAAVWQHESYTAKERPQLMAKAWLGTHAAMEGAFEKFKRHQFSYQGCSKLSPATNMCITTSLVVLWANTANSESTWSQSPSSPSLREHPERAALSVCELWSVSPWAWQLLNPEAAQVAPASH